MMGNLEELKNWFQQNFEHNLFGRYIHSKAIRSLLNQYSEKFEIEVIGYSVNNLPIYKMIIGNGAKKIMMWSQMHGNESTTTKAVFDLLKLLVADNKYSTTILKNCTLCIVPMLSPDGAMAYTRMNANEIDLNRDAQDLSQPESKVLRGLYNDFKPHYCFNLHDQRTIFNVGDTNRPATVSFLSPAEDEERTITITRKKSMEIIAVMNDMLQQVIPNQVGRYDDGFNINCVGDTFQSFGVPTILFESGHYQNDYEREKTREFIFYSLVEAIQYIAINDVTGIDKYEDYFNIPENNKLFLDIIYRAFPIIIDNLETKTDIGVFFKETLKNNKIEFIPQIEKTGDLSHLFGHKEFMENELQYRPMNIDQFKAAYLNSEKVLKLIKFL